MRRVVSIGRLNAWFRAARREKCQNAMGFGPIADNRLSRVLGVDDEVPGTELPIHVNSLYGWFGNVRTSNNYG